LDSYQNLVLLQNLYRLKHLGFDYIENFEVNHSSSIGKVSSLDELKRSVDSCYLCDLSKSRKQSMFGYGNTDADVMFIDFNVSEMQNLKNSYYVGRSGEILKKMINNVLKLNVEDVYYTHQVKCKALNSNLPSLSEYNSCKSYLFSQIEFIKPKVIVVLGEYVYKNLFGESANSFESVRGHDIDFMNSKLVPIYHPLFLLRNPELKKITLKDLQKIKSYL